MYLILFSPSISYISKKEPKNGFNVILLLKFLIVIVHLVGSFFDISVDVQKLEEPLRLKTFVSTIHKTKFDTHSSMLPSIEINFLLIKLVYVLMGAK
jgi:hypothetical protein